MPQKKTFLTPEGLAKLEEELAHLRTVRRAEVAAKIQRAKELGSTVDNAEYDDAQNERAFIEGRILTLEQMIQNAAIIHHDGSSRGRVEMGSLVTVATEDGKQEQYVIVGSTEANPSQGKISNESPVGRALMGKQEGDKVKVEVPAGVFKLKILKIH
ncbi:MAG: transcription elongation factor GreA [Chloroflexi bacterium]|nr:transcription elongation factor GreA [Chloroflexota bacterium]